MLLEHLDINELNKLTNPNSINKKFDTIVINSPISPPVFEQMHSPYSDRVGSSRDHI